MKFKIFILAFFGIVQLQAQSAKKPVVAKKNVIATTAKPTATKSTTL
jgi:hypothetical protein